MKNTEQNRAATKFINPYRTEKLQTDQQQQQQMSVTDIK